MSILHPLRLALALGLAAALAAPAGPTAAQYFGRNKVQHRTFDFQVLSTPHFDVYFYPEAEDAAREAARMAERWYGRLSRLLDHEFTERQPIILYASHPHFQQTTVLAGDVHEATGGVTEAFKQRIVMPFAHAAAETDQVLGHEIVHAFQYDISGLGRAGAGIEAALGRFQVPLWFMEGMAEYLSLGPDHALTAIWLRNAALAGELPTIRQLGGDPNVFPYRYGHAVWAYVGGRWGDAVIGQILKLAGSGVPYEAAFQQVLNVSLDELSDDWHAAVRRAYLPQLAGRREAREEAQPLITRRRGSGRLNLGPSLSPDGRWVAFLSEQKSGDVALLLADAATGRVVRRLQRGAALDPHFGSLRYIHSAGSWSPDGRQFAFTALRGGRDVLVLVDVERAARVRSIAVAEASELSSPTWSPDGRTVVVSGLSGGRTDLFAVDLASAQARRLTSDPFAALQPAFSPDGRTIAFVTDRFGADPEALRYGPYRIGLLDVETGRIRAAPDAGGSHSIDPHWAADGASLYLVSNRSGVPNVYRMELESGALHRLTNLFSGVSGITALSPALSVSRGGDRLLFTAFEEDGWNVYRLDGAAALAGIPAEAAADEDARLAMRLPPTSRDALPLNRVAGALGDPLAGLPPRDSADAYPSSPYRARLGLDYLGQPQAGVSLSTGPFGGAGLYGGISGVFSDVLGIHRVGGVVQASGQWDEIGVALQYLNEGRRWNFGVGVQRIPHVYGYSTEELLGSTLRQEIVRLRYFDAGVTGFARYPLSHVQRVEFGVGLRRLTQDAQLWEILYDLRTGAASAGNRQDVDGIGYTMVEGSTAWVFDSALFGWTAPVSGQRARFEIAPVVGELRFTRALADVRRYLFVQPFTLAVRALHYGRYGRDAEGVFSELYLGEPSLLRGYDGAYGNCVSRGQDCAVLNQMLGSRIAAGSVELRMPLVGARQRALPPIDVHAFVDAGVAWTRDSTPTFSTAAGTDAAERPLLTSAGAGLRTNLFGAMILEIDYVRPFALSDDWRWVFALQPGF